MEDLIPLVIKLQEAFDVIAARQSIELPIIVSVGSQSSGKSSVIEAIVGKDFLPRGTGIVTRCPLVLSLRRTQKDDKNKGEWGEFLHKKGVKFTNFDQIRTEIDAQTDVIAGSSGKCLSEKPISLTIYSPNVVDLTLVDLPGITKVPVHGQPADVEEQIRKLILKFITQPNALILAITAANQDIANSDALKLAESVDPKRERTIGVITKIDLMDEGTDALEILSNKTYPLELGYYGVKCRSQQNIKDNVTVKDAIEREKKYFEGHHVYQARAKTLGIPYLSRSLNLILIAHIKKCIPTLNQQISMAAQEKERELQKWSVNPLQGDALSEVDNGPLVLALINKFINAYSDKLEGKFVQQSAVEVQGGSRINFIFHNVFRKVISQIDPFEYLSEQDIQTAIKNASAMQTSLFVPEGAFEVLVKQQIARLLEPSLDCAYQVYEELRRVVIEVNLPELSQFYKLQSKICDVMENVLDKCLTPTCEMIMNIMEIENALINTNHPDFVGSADSLLNLFKDDQSEGEEEDKTYSLFNRKAKSEDNMVDDFQVEGDEAVQESNDDERQDDRKEIKNTMFQNVFGYESQDFQKAADQRKKEQAVNEKQLLDRRNFGIANLPDKSNLPGIVLSNVPQVMRALAKQESARVIMETRIIQNLIHSYFNIVKTNISDMVPKSVMAFLINESRRIAQSELVCQIYKSGDIDSLLVEDPMVVANRQNAKKMLAALREAQKLLVEVDQFQLKV